MDDLAVRLGVHELIGEYAERIDEDRLEEWPELFGDPCRYLVISRANHEAGMRQGGDVRRVAWDAAGSGFLAAAR
jgi:3-phenylpropionate/cinnamic acid dioxygenase small subunit